MKINWLYQKDHYTHKNEYNHLKLFLMKKICNEKKARVQFTKIKENHLGICQETKILYKSIKARILIKRNH